MGARSSSLRNGIDGLGLKAPNGYGIAPSEESRRKLEYFLKGNHFNYGFLFNNRSFHNHLPHALISAYFLGASPQQLSDLYEKDISTLEPWKEDSPTVVTDDDWFEFLGRKDYERGYFDYFSDKINDSKHDWKDIVKEFLTDKYHVNLIPGLFGGLVHPLIHLGYAIEADSPLLGIEALAMSCTEYVDLSKVLTTSIGNRPEQQPVHIDLLKDPVAILNEIRQDPEFDGKLQRPYQTRLPVLFENFASKINYYSERLDSSNPKELIKKLLHTGVLLLTTTHKDDDPLFDFFLLHILTSTQETAEIILSPAGNRILPESRHIPLVKTLWTVTVALYISQLRPLIKPERVSSIEIGSVEDLWKDTIYRTLNGPKKHDSHLIKAVRSMLVAEILLNDTSGFYARAAHHFVMNRPNSEYTGRTSSTQLLDVKY